MRRSTLLAALALASFPLIAGAETYWTSHDSRQLSISIEHVDDITDCSQIHVTRGGRAVATVTQDLPVGSMRSLTVNAVRNGGVRLVGSSGQSFSAKACKASMAGDPASIPVTVRGDEISSADAARDDMVFFIVNAPRGANVTLKATNGQIAVKDFDGPITAQTQNGPISVKGTTGNVVATAVNGPIAFSGRSGNVKLRAENGPVAVTLEGYDWTGSLDASTTNGPLALQLAPGYRSGVLLESQRGPFSCNGSCEGEGGRRARDYDGDQPHRMRFGSGDPLVRLSTVNGPVSVSQ